MGRRRAEDDAVRRFDGWSSTYEQSLIWRHYFDPIHLLMLAEIGDVSGLDVLDLGFGTGDMLRKLALAGASRLAGIDPSEGMLEVARGLCDGYANIELHRGSAESLPFGDGEFDVVTSCMAFHHFPDPGGALAEAARVLRPCGRLFICDLDGEGVIGRAVLAYGRLRRADDFYFDRQSLLELTMATGFETLGAGRVRQFPPTMLVSAARKP